MRGFVQEGRVIAGSLITHDLTRGFFRASAYPVFSEWSAAAQPAAVAEQSQVQVAVGQTHSPSYIQASSPSVFVIMAEIRSNQAMLFLQTLQSFGHAQRLGDSVWLLKATTTADHLRKTLSQTLEKQDRLFILDSGKNEPAWFNIGADMDQRLRNLWEEDS